MKGSTNRIQAIREERGISRDELAKKLQTTRMRIWRIENGVTKLRVEDLPRFARALRVEIAELVAA